MNASFGAPTLKRQIHFMGPHVETPLAKAVGDALEAQGLAVTFEPSWLVKFGAVYVDHVRALEPEIPVGPGAVIRVHLNPKRYDLKKDEIKKRTVAETEDYVVINKPSGLPMHPTLDNFHEHLLAAFDHPVYITHRLDVPTSGLVLIAKTKEYQTLFNGVICRRELRKIYEARVQSPVAPGIYRHFMRVTDRAPKEMAALIPPGDEKNWDECLLKIVTGLECHETHLLQLELLTGRTHQIRAQLSFLGAPIMGDEMYGGPAAETFGLHASYLSFTCPKTGKFLEFKSPQALVPTLG